MLSRIFISIALLLLFACTEKSNPNSPQKTPFPNMESLIDNQISLLLKAGKGLEKELLNQDGKTETQTILVDSLRWSQELKLFRQIDLNRPEWIAEYDIEQKENVIVATTNLEKLPIKRFEMVGTTDIPVYLKIESHAESLLYESRQTLELYFDKGLLKRYEIKGSQKIITGSAMPYRIKGKVI
ncbi:MAG: hypothetical protein JJT94_07555 [Bernardetiaceae bacterium]|nr:hypothetical protein [Bernardetiaceae bacterium]